MAPSAALTSSTQWAHARGRQRGGTRTAQSSMRRGRSRANGWARKAPHRRKGPRPGRPRRRDATQYKASARASAYARRCPKAPHPRPATTQRRNTTQAWRVMPAAIPGLAARGPAWRRERDIGRRTKEEGDKEEDAWRARALRRGTNVSSRRQRRKCHVVRNVPIREHTMLTLHHPQFPSGAHWRQEDHAIATIFNPDRDPTCEVRAHCAWHALTVIEGRALAALTSEGGQSACR